ncbi:TrmB family transcriptional regulator [Candidatus Woesearchaeota archaeon]|nr:TrmB family transcriptional regulator [Candidatus Woesearchaeota archaeon]
MIANEELLKKLRSTFNLNIYEVKVWTSLLSKGAATAGELSDMSNVPRSRSYDVLESLEKKGFIIMKLGRPIKYLAVQPSEIIKRVKKGLQDRAESQIKAIEEIQKTDVFQELTLLFSQGITHVDPSTIAGSFKGRNNIYDHVLNLLDNASKEVVIATTPEGIARKLEYMKTTLRKLNNKKIKIRIAAPLKTDKAKEAAKELSDIADVKDIDVNARFIIVDGKDLVFMVSNDKATHESMDVGIWVNTPFFAGALRTMFDSVWNK